MVDQRDFSNLFLDWQNVQKQLLDSTESEPTTRLTSQLDGVASFYEEYPYALVQGYFGEVYKCWLFFQFASGALGMHTPQGSLFVHGWRTTRHVLDIAEKLRAPALVKQLKASIKALSLHSETDLDRYDRYTTYNLLTHTYELEPLDYNDESGLAKEISALLDVPFDKVVKSAVCEGPKLSRRKNEYDGSNYPILAALAFYVDGIIQEDPKVVEALGSVEDDIGPEFIQDPPSSHHIKAAKAATPAMLKFCSQHELWLSDYVDRTPMSVNPGRGFNPLFLKTKNGQLLCFVGFHDGDLLIDYQGWSEIWRRYFEKKNERWSNISGVNLRSNPNFYVDHKSGKIKYGIIGSLFSKRLKYAEIGSK